MRDVAVISFSQLLVDKAEANDAELVMPVVREALGRAGLQKQDIGFTCSGSSDFLTGMPFSFVGALDAVGPWPPIEESHVEMDGAWALYEAWVRLQHGDIDTALVYAFGRSTLGPIEDILALQLDPYYEAPMWPDATSLAALQARALLDSGRLSDSDKKKATAEPPKIVDGAAAVVLASGDRARKLCSRPAFISGIDHRIESHLLGVRDLSHSVSTEIAAKHAGCFEKSPTFAELHAPYSAQELILCDALKLDKQVTINPSGGAQNNNAVMVAGLIRIGEAATRVSNREADCALAHASSGPCLQQNLICMLEARA